jgi:AbrB family looped-hinge helix DNA binding protein
MEATVTAKGQTTIPKEIREKLGLKAGSKIKFFLRHDGEAVILPVASAAALRGNVHYRGPPVTIEEMDDAIAAEVGERDERSRSR